MTQDQTIDLAQRRQNRKERKAKRLAMLKAMQRMRDDGFSTVEVAASLGITPQMVTSHAARHLGITINRSWARRLGAWVPSNAAMIVRKIAEQTGRTPSYVAGRLLAIALEGDGRMAIRMLGKEALPPKSVASAPDAPVKPKRELQREVRAKADAEAKAIAGREREALAKVKGRAA